MRYKVPFIKPTFPTAEVISDDYKAIVESNWYTNFGPFERRFAENLGEYVGKDYKAATFSSATSGLIASLIAVHGLGDGTKYILMPSFTFAAGADAIIMSGYKPLFIDINLTSIQMDIEEAKKAINKFGKQIIGILYCNSFGVGSSEIEEWESLASAKNIPMVIDSAAGYGSIYSDGTKVGTHGACEVFSFHATKTFAIGEGGGVTSKDKKLITALEEIQNFGFDDTKSAKRIGYNGKLQEINAAIGLRQLQQIDKIIDERHKTYSLYRDMIDNEKYIFQPNAENSSLCFANVIIKRSERRDKKISQLQRAGIEAKAYYNPPLHAQQGFYNYLRLGELENTQTISKSIISLPSYGGIDKADVYQIARILNE